MGHPRSVEGEESINRAGTPRAGWCRREKTASWPRSPAVSSHPDREEDALVGGSEIARFLTKNSN